MENKALNQFINKWEDLAFNYYSDLFEENKNLKASDFIQKYSKADWNVVYGRNLKMIKDLIAKDAKKRKADFMKRISKKVGNIQEVNLYMADNLEINGTAKGDKGEATVTSIIAGGYNIQKAHYRVLVK